MTYFDPTAEAQMNGHAHGIQQGRQQGEEIGYQNGFHDGHARGKREGWDQAIDRANIEMAKQKEFTAIHANDKQRLQLEVHRQQEIIAQLTARLNELEGQNILLQEANQGLRNVVTSLQKENEKLSADIQRLDEQVEQQAQEYTEQVYQLNRCAVFMNTTRSVLEELTADNHPGAAEVIKLFAKRYSEHVQIAINEGTIVTPLDLDDVSARTMPRTQQFIQGMLESAKNLEELEQRIESEEPSA